MRSNDAVRLSARDEERDFCCRCRCGWVVSLPFRLGVNCALLAMDKWEQLETTTTMTTALFLSLYLEWWCCWDDDKDGNCSGFSRRSNAVVDDDSRSCDTVPHWSASVAWTRTVQRTAPEIIASIQCRVKCSTQYHHVHFSFSLSLWFIRSIALYSFTDFTTVLWCERLYVLVLVFQCMNVDIRCVGEGVKVCYGRSIQYLS